MCGICGIAFDDPGREVDISILKKINRTMIYRGPDDEGYYLGKGCGLAMRRLSIIDVEGGHQPFSSEDGGIVSVCNGELYNFRDIKRELSADGIVLKSKSDADVLPHLYERDGVGLVHHLKGMFAFAVWDEKEKTLILARDRMGQKPLYYARHDGALLFASELKALLEYPGFHPALNKKALAKYLTYEYVPAPDSILEGVSKLEPGHLLHFKAGKISVRRYWDLPVGEELNIGESEARERFMALFDQSVQRRLISDVPLGVFLSGGLDSSSVVAMIARHREAVGIKTFSIAFSEKSFDESSYARSVAKHFGTDHREEVLSPENLIALFPEVTALLDEPLGDASIIPTYALSRFTRKYVTVALGGDGGDELFAGYPTFQAERFANYYRKIPRLIRNGVIEKLVSALPTSDENISLDFKIKQFIKGAGREDLSRHATWMGSFSEDELKKLLSFDSPPELYEDTARHFKNSMLASKGNRVLYSYKKLYLADDILTKVDRASMWSSLEARAPFMDHELVEFIFRLPYRFKLSGMTMKYLLKKTFEDILPKGIAHRSKKGFGIPVAKWIKGPIREMTCDLLAPEKIGREGFLNPKYVSEILDRHLSGKEDNRKKLWTLIIFEKWLENWGARACARPE